jgi:hypothetical protein
MAKITMSASNEIRSYISSSNTNVVFGGMGICFVALQIISLARGLFTKTLPIYLVIYAVIAVIWYTQRRNAYMAVDLDKKTLSGIPFFFLLRKKIPITSITHIGTRRMFAGGMTVMTVTYTLPDGKKSTVNAGAKQSFDPISFHEILKAIIKINPKLQIPPELRN